MISSKETINAEPVVNDPWSDLDAEFDAWCSSGRVADLWWRDDDAIMSGTKLDQLVDITSKSGLLLAAIPASLENSLVSSLNSVSHVVVAQHGYAHVNHAPRGLGLGAWELGLHRGLDAVMADLDEGRARIRKFFGERFMPVVVPPWNRIAPELMHPLAERGYVGVSAFGARNAKYPVPGLIAVNSHCDPIRWKSGACFAGERKTIMQLVQHLRGRRAGSHDAEEPTGFLTHHIDLDADGWKFCRRLANAVEQHSGARWVSPMDVFEVSS